MLTHLICLPACRHAYGSNTHRERPPVPFLRLVYETLKDPIILLLIAAATVRALG